ncbi:Trm112 family protein [Streptomyces sp. R302]|uniref:Trm112 family protein n=1 Tax=unclassified Streptomyces TaxID=2593676 RepID=UPI00145E9B59|nr:MULTISPECIES: Trm112 family protein [unclassified Streptomyces]NML51664.1 Trm112 family protein [Streptomyces sp. R301]NML81284.1 Trm112 family protein [Streptomyces sp. R302]
MSPAPSRPSPALDDTLLRILACPLDKGPLTPTADRDALYNPRLRLRYPIVDGIPQLLPSSGERVPAEAHERYVKGVGTPAG